MEKSTVRIDFSKTVGSVKPVNGVGQPPMIDQLADYPMFKYLSDAGIPYSRLHDVGGWLGGGLYVDIPNLFPDFDADENLPENYCFAYTDSLLKALKRHDVEPFFRLGVTIENFVYYPDRFPPKRILPPKDFAKWARICEHVILHYNEGWANGLHLGIKYWEIWNEPENSPDEKLNPMFMAPFSEYIRFYGVAATYLKKQFPELKIGGYASCGFYAGAASAPIGGANCSPRMEHFIICAKEFLAAVRDEKWPLDYFSFHSYSAPKEAMEQVVYADNLLNSYGFTADKCERIFNEWLPYAAHENVGTAFQASAIAAELIGLQKSSCSIACIYDARCNVGSYSPLFNPMTYKPHKAYYAFTAFNELRKLGNAIDTSSNDPAIWAVAAKDSDGSNAAVMIANYSDQSIPLALDIQGYKAIDCIITDDNRTAENAPIPSEMPRYSFALVKLERQ